MNESLPQGWIEGKCQGCGHALKAPVVSLNGKVESRPNVFPESCWRCASDEREATGECPDCGYGKLQDGPIVHTANCPNVTRQASDER